MAVGAVGSCCCWWLELAGSGKHCCYRGLVLADAGPAAGDGWFWRLLVLAVDAAPGGGWSWQTLLLQVSAAGGDRCLSRLVLAKDDGGDSSCWWVLATALLSLWH